MTENLQVAIRIRPILRSEIGKEEVVDSNVFFKQGNQITVHDSTHLIQSHYD